MFGQEGVAAFGAEEVLFVVGAFPERWVVKSDKTFIDDGGFAVVATRRKVLLSRNRYFC